MKPSSYFKSNVILKDKYIFISKIVICKTLMWSRWVVPLISLVNFKEQLLYGYRKLLYFFDLMLKAVIALLFTAVQDCLILLGWNFEECLACCLVFSSLSWTDVVLSPPEYFKAGQVNSSDSTYKSTCRILKANNLNCKTKTLKSQMAYLTCYSVRAHTKTNQCQPLLV